MPTKKVEDQPVKKTTKKPTATPVAIPPVHVDAPKLNTVKVGTPPSFPTPKKDVVVPILVGAIIVASFVVGFLYGKVTVYEKLGTEGSTAKQPAAQAAAGDQEAAPTVSKAQLQKLVADKKNITFGNPNSKVIFAEFSDPSCPYCHIAGGKNPELNKQVGDRFKLVADGGTYQAPVLEMKKLVDQGKAAFVWMYSPGHGNGELGTQALYCAHEQGKFWPVNDLLMTNAGYTLLNETVKNDKTKIPQLVDFVKNVVNTTNFQKCLADGKYADRVKSDESTSREFGVQGTPSFYVNEKNYGGAYNYTDMQSTVDAALK